MPSSSNPNEQWAMTLHNYLQTLKKHNSLSWKDNVVGPQHTPTWTSTCYIDDHEYGKAVSSTKQSARDLAAKAALDTLLKSKQ